MRAAEVGYPVVGYDITAARVDGLRARHSYVEDVTDAQIVGRARRGLPAHVRRGRPPRLRRSDHHRPDAADRGCPRPLVHRGRRQRPCAAPAGGRARRARVDHLPGDHRRAVAADPRSGRAAQRGRPLRRLLARTHRPGQTVVHLHQHRQGRVGHRSQLARWPSRSSTAAWSTRSSPSRPPPRPSSRSCSRTRSGT